MMSMGESDCAESAAIPEGQYIYVSPLGDDGWSGRLADPAADRSDGPFRTLARAVKDLKPGWTCFLRAGVYREILRPETGGADGRPIIFRNYLDEVAVISGADPLGAWTDEGDGIFSAPMDWNLNDQNQVFGDGAMLTEARWPHNSGSLFQPIRAKATTGTMSSLTDPTLPGGEDAWKGALLWCAGGDKWICWSEKIERYDAATHTLFFKMSTPQHWYEVRPGSSYVLMGLRSSLGAPGEWWYDAEQRRMLLIPPKGSDIAKLSVEAKRRLDCIDLSGMVNVQIIGLRFRSGGVRTDEKTCAIR
ncbi:MAG: hypothetical protein WCK00_15575, partial [Deltaproteobacteria bacterium]